MPKTTKITLVVLLSLFICACGGGGGGSSSTPPLPTPLDGSYTGTWSCTDGTSGDAWANLSQDEYHVTGTFGVTGSSLITGTQTIDVTLPDLSGSFTYSYTYQGYTITVTATYSSEALHMTLSVGSFQVVADLYK